MTSLMKSEELTAGQGIHKVNAERYNRKKEAEDAIKTALNESTTKVIADKLAELL
jgi:hypothetical protein